MLVTVVAGRGSIPRKAGAYRVVGENGRVTGTIGGGNLEMCIRDRSYMGIIKGICISKERGTEKHEVAEAGFVKDWRCV